MTPESIKMSNLIMDAEMQCEAKGHSMDWQRYSNYRADAECRYCKRYVSILMKMTTKSVGAALNINCTKKGSP